jgi:hypothetical protein
VTFKERLDVYVKAHKLTPGQQVNLLIYYLGVRLMFPEISFERYLERTLVVSGATPENCTFPKDALDKYCPNKGSQWSPAERIALMLTYLEFCNALAAENLPEPVFADFLAEETPLVKAPAEAVPAADTQPTLSGFATPASEAVAPVTAVPAAVPPAITPTVAPPVSVTPTNPPMEIPQAIQQTMSPEQPEATKAARKSSRKTATPTHQFVVGERANYRVPQGPVLLGAITATWTTDQGVLVYTFQSDAGEVIQVADAALLEVPYDPPVPPVERPLGAAVQRLVLTPEQAAAVEGYLAMTAPSPQKAIGECFLGFSVPFAAPCVVGLDIINAQPKPYIDAYLSVGAGVSIDCEPREVSIYGDYRFVHNNQTYIVEVVRAA